MPSIDEEDQERTAARSWLRVAVPIPHTGPEATKAHTSSLSREGQDIGGRALWELAGVVAPHSCAAVRGLGCQCK